MVCAEPIPGASLMKHFRDLKSSQSLTRKLNEKPSETVAELTPNADKGIDIT